MPAWIWHSTRALFCLLAVRRRCSTLCFGNQICPFCWNRLMEEAAASATDAKCPACRTGTPARLRIWQSNSSADCRRVHGVCNAIGGNAAPLRVCRRRVVLRRDCFLLTAARRTQPTRVTITRKSSPKTIWRVLRAKKTPRRRPRSRPSATAKPTLVRAAAAACSRVCVLR